jgi:hypothetical protein
MRATGNNPMTAIRLRFVTCNDPVSEGIRLRENFWASHVEAVTPAGNGLGPNGLGPKYLGAHADGGVQARDPGYDAAILRQELFVELAETTPGQADEFYAFLNRHIGEPYDFESILGFLVPDVAAHQSRHIICSALQTLALRQCGWFAAPLVEPAHKISPRDLLLILSGRVAVQM